MIKQEILGGWKVGFLATIQCDKVYWSTLDGFKIGKTMS